MKKSISKLFTLILAAMLVVGLLAFNAGAETTTAGGDPSPAITVYQKTSSSVVGIITIMSWMPRASQRVPASRAECMKVSPSSPPVFSRQTSAQRRIRGESLGTW